MKQTYLIHAEPRSLQGKGASRRLRREGKVPAIVYGGDGQAVAISADANEIKKHAYERGFFSQLLDLELEGKREQVVVQDIQRHPAREYIMHLDFQRVRANQALRSHVQLEFEGIDDCPGVKNNDGVMERIQVQIEIECLPKDLPEYITVDVSAMDIGDVIRLSDLVLPEGVQSVALMHEEDPAIAAVQVSRAGVEAEAEEAAEGEAGGEGEGEGESKDAEDAGNADEKPADE